MIAKFMVGTGILLVAFGLGLAWVPLGFIAAGLGTAAAGLFLDFPDREKAGEQ